MESHLAKRWLWLERVANDVDEEVYGNDGADRHEAQEADQSGQLDIYGEAKTARTLRTLEPPTDAASRRVVVNKTSDTLPKFQTDYMFIRTVALSKTQICVTFVETRCGVVISFMCARKGGYEDLTKDILRHFEAYGFFNPIIIQCDKR